MFGSQTRKKRMSYSYSENYLAYQDSLSLTKACTVLWNISSSCTTKKTKIYSICLQIRGLSGNRGELKNIPETFNIKDLKHRGAERVWVQVLQNRNLIVTESSSCTSGIIWGTLGWREERRATDFSVILMNSAISANSLKVLTKTENCDFL